MWPGMLFTLIKHKISFLLGCFVTFFVNLLASVQVPNKDPLNVRSYYFKSATKTITAFIISLCLCLLLITNGENGYAIVFIV